MKFKFLPRGGRRFKSAYITVSFLDMEDSPAPSVEDIAPNGRFALDRSVDLDKVTWEVGVTGVTIPPGITINITPLYKRIKITDKTSNATVTGFATFDHTRALKQMNGKRNVVEWWLEENADRKHGVPTWLQGAILLKHDTSLKKGPAPFKVLVEIKVDIDGRPWSRSITFKTPEGDPQILDPAQPSLRKDWKVDNLGAEDLQALQKMLMFMLASEPVLPTPETKLAVN